MNRRLLKILVCLVLVLLAAEGVFAARLTQNFTLNNETGETMVVLQIGPAGTGRWRNEDELDEFTIASGASVAVTFEPWEDAQYWDIRAYFEDGTYGEWHNFDLFSISEITLNKNGVATYR
ncbi:MAG: hypothetical protein IJT21_07565 [Synergistaceae bacterium]|nr:hypothetical protein [Synergistaceae bacterium]